MTIDKVFKNIPKPVILTILDGWGIGNEESNNSIYQADIPTWHYLMQNYPHTEIITSGEAVGLPKGQMGNSEVGHMTIGSGRVILQDLERINQAFLSKEIEHNKYILSLINDLYNSNKTCHIMGLCSDGGVHSHIDHIKGITELLANKNIDIKLHLFLDGRDTSPDSGIIYIEEMEKLVQKYPHVSIATITGRYYAMDRDKNWDRTKLAYDAIISGHGAITDSFINAINTNYKNNITDEFITPLVNKDYQGAKENDSLIMINFRADRALQILDSITDVNFTNFIRSKSILFNHYIGFSHYSEKLSKYFQTLFDKAKTVNTLGEIIAKSGKSQLRVAETEKYAHVTFFFNAGYEQPYENEDRILIPSPNVKTYDLKPEMSATELTDAVISAIEKDHYDLIILNYANADMVGHSGNLQATIKAIETLDKCLARLVEEINKIDGVMIITADHGNAESMIDSHNGKIITSHTTNPVPLLLIGKMIDKSKISLYQGSLQDIAPTILDIMDIDKPIEMKGSSLINYGN
jgi:2,3-bisphosphoglycerate-independent phosphoglycerate mutase